MISNNSLNTAICLIRHGETDWNATGRLQGSEDIELNGAGRLQADSLADYFSREPWDMIISSPLLRASETAKIIASRIRLSEVKIVDELKERNYGKASGLLPDERKGRYPDGIYPGQEEFEHLRSRAMKALSAIVLSYPGKRIIVVSHGAWINSILYTISKGEFGSFKTRLKNACLNQISYYNDKWNVVFYNKTVEEV